MPSTRQVSMVSTSDRKRLSSPMRDDRADEGGGDAGQRQRADDDADDGAGDADRQRVLGALGERIDCKSDGLAPALEEGAGDDQRDDDQRQYVDAVFMKEAAASPSAIQKTMRKASGPISAASGVPRIRTM